MSGESMASERSSTPQEQPWYIDMLATGLVKKLRAHPVLMDDCSARQRGLSTLDWGKRYLAKYFVRPPSRMHLWLGEQFDLFHERRGSKLNVIGPRGGAKSTIGTLCYVLRMAAEGLEPYIWIVSDTKNQAQTHLENIKVELEHNPILAIDYPLAAGRGPCWRATTIVLNNGVVIESFGTGQRLRGRRRRENRPTLIVCDDLQNDGHIASAAQRASSNQWFRGTLLKAGTKQTNIINLATALHREALAMQLERTAGWQSAKFQAVIHWPTNAELWSEWEAIYSDVSRPRGRQEAWNFYQRHRPSMDEGTELLWPEEEDLYTLMKMRVEEGQSAFNREKQSSPIDPQRCEWPEEYLSEHIWCEQWPGDLLFRVIALDPSKGSQSRHGDYSAFVVLGIDQHGMLFAEADLSRRPASQIVVDGANLCQLHKVDAFGVEANQFQELLADEFQAEFEKRGMRELAVCKIHNHVNKLMRIRRLGSYLSQRRLRFLTGSESTRLLVDQLRDFPLGSHDDGPDALEMALRMLVGLQRGRDDRLGERLPIGG